MNLNVRANVLDQLRQKGRGWVFTILDFPATQDKNEFKNVLRALCMAGRVRKVAAGVFHYPRKIRHLNLEVPPEPIKVARAVAKLGGHRIALTGAEAANRFGLSTQVPAKLAYLTDGPDKVIHLGKTTLRLRHVPADCVRVGGPLERALVQAILYLGPDALDEKAIQKLRQAVPPTRRHKVFAAGERFGGWVGQILQKIAAPPLPETVEHG